MSEKRVKSAVNQAVYYRNYRRARDRALTRLATAYPEDYKELLEQEKASDEQEGRRWLDIHGTTGNVDTRSATPVSTRTEASNAGEDEGYNGGEA